MVYAVWDGTKYTYCKAKPYINDNVYGVAHNNSIKEILDPTMKQYDAQIVMRDIND